MQYGGIQPAIFLFVILKYIVFEKSAYKERLQHLQEMVFRLVVVTEWQQQVLRCITQYVELLIQQEITIFQIIWIIPFVKLVALVF